MVSFQFENKDISSFFLRGRFMKGMNVNPGLKFAYDFVDIFFKVKRKPIKDESFRDDCTDFVLFLYSCFPETLNLFLHLIPNYKISQWSTICKREILIQSCRLHISRVTGRLLNSILSSSYFKSVRSSVKSYYLWITLYIRKNYYFSKIL